MTTEEYIKLLENNNKFYEEYKKNYLKAKYSSDLEDRIDKAIEYIESYIPNYDFDKTNLIKLLEILQGSDKE